MVCHVSGLCSTETQRQRSCRSFNAHGAFLFIYLFIYSFIYYSFSCKGSSLHSCYHNHHGGVNVSLCCTLSPTDTVIVEAIAPSHYLTWKCHIFTCRPHSREMLSYTDVASIVINQIYIPPLDMVMYVKPLYLKHICVIYMCV